MGGFFLIKGLLFDWCVIGANFATLRSLSQAASFARNNIPPAIQIVQAARSGVTSFRKRALSSTTSEKIPIMIAKPMKERIIRQRWQVLPRAGLFRDKVITSTLFLPLIYFSKALVIQDLCHQRYTNAQY